MKWMAMAMLLMSCSTPYQEMGFSGGYANTRLSTGRYMVEARVNSYTSMGTALAYAHRRAGELCANGYDVIDGAKSQSDSYARIGDTVQNMPKSSVSLVIQCRTEEAQSKTRAGRAVIDGDEPVYCYSNKGDVYDGLCFDDLAECEGARDKRDADPDSNGMEFSYCKRASNTACFWGTSVLSGRSFRNCYPSVSSCERALKHFGANPDFDIGGKRCAIYSVDE